MATEKSKSQLGNVPEDEMAALESMEIATENQDKDVTNRNSLGMVDMSPKIQRDERLQRLEFIEVNKANMNYSGTLYPSSWKFKCRAALGSEVANFSTIDNEDPLSVNDGINELLKTCLSIESGGKKLSYKNLYEMDRLWFVLFIRDLTMIEAEQKIQYETKCNLCYESNVVTLSYDNFINREFSDTAKKYWDDDENAFMVQTKSYGVLKFQPSTIYRAELFKDWMIDQSQKHNKPNATFVKLYWMLLNNDNQYDKDAVQKAYADFIAISNDQKKLSIYMKLNNDLMVGITEQIKYKCEHCEKEALADIRFPDGINSILLMSDIDSELL